MLSLGRVVLLDGWKVKRWLSCGVMCLHGFFLRSQGLRIKLHGLMDLERMLLQG